MRVIDREKRRATLDTTKRLKAAHRAGNEERAKDKLPPLPLREFARVSAAVGGELGDYAKQWFSDKRTTDHPKRARSKFVLAERAQRRWARRAKGNPKGKKAK